MQYQILYQEIPAYGSEVQKAHNIGEVQTSTKKLFARLMEQVFKDDVLVIRPKAQPPQEIEQQEEVKGDGELVGEVVAETRGFEADRNAFDVACQQDA